MVERMGEIRGRIQFLPSMVLQLCKFLCHNMQSCNKVMNMLVYYRSATEPSSLPVAMSGQRMLQVDANRLVLAWSSSHDIWIYDRASSRKKTSFLIFTYHILD